MKLPIWLWFFLPLAVLLWSANALFSTYRSYQRTKAEVVALEREVEALTQRLPQALAEAPLREEELPRLYQGLFRLAESQGLELHAMEPGEAESAGNVRAWRLHLKLQGPYPGVLGFLEVLPSLDQPLWVESYALEPAGERGERLALDLTLRILAP
ncbi:MULTISPECIES: type 4a pilus biogenesis protein PilO [Thermus]|uniref:type 4a pilus biogenesis protein PilO n=1 Tax=Thermus TaxID=270 RepID=UPI001FA9DE3C|nr:MULTISPECIES: type 4a pilus biogenesis protein PilO [Thermus]